MVPISSSLETLESFPDSLASLVLEQYSSLHFQLPPQQYTILAGFALACSSSKVYKTISIATGSKCLPATRLSPHGDSLNDSHAEVLARRGALRWFMEEVQRTHSPELAYKSQWITRMHSGRYRLRDSVRLHMYISTLPCGDASTRFVALYQDEQVAHLKDSTLFPVQPADKPWRGRNNYHSYGVLRTKPGRADSPSSLSMSCSDKIASWNVLGLQGGLGAHIFMPLYISSIVIGDVEEKIQDVMKQESERAFWRRIDELEDLPEGYIVNRSEIRFTSLQFMHSRTILSKSFPLLRSCNDSVCWIADSPRKQEVTTNGMRRGVSLQHRHNSKYRPVLSKLALYQVFHHTLHVLPDSFDVQVATYYPIKQRAADYQRAKTLLFRSNPFTAWIRNGIEWQNFDLNGNVNDVQPAVLPARDGMILSGQIRFEASHPSTEDITHNSH